MSRLPRFGRKANHAYSERVRAAAFSRRRRLLRTVTSHAANLAESACKRASGDRLWCGWCHDAHSTPSNTAQWFRAKCLACHAVSACAEKSVARAAVADSCITCHMPRLPVTDAQHVVYTDHSIRRRPIFFCKTNPIQPPSPWSHQIWMLRIPAISASLTRCSPPANRTRRTGHAPSDFCAAFYKTNPMTRKFFLILRVCTGRDPRTGRLSSSTRGFCGSTRGNRALPPLSGHTRWSGAIMTKPSVSGPRRFGSARRLLLVRVNLASALIRTGRHYEARAVLEKALEFNPEFPAARKLLDEIR